ncbi:hypothetical protein pb186bvf_010003 [Paramecium bursaria]
MVWPLVQTCQVFVFALSNEELKVFITDLFLLKIKQLGQQLGDKNSFQDVFFNQIVAHNKIEERCKKLNQYKWFSDLKMKGVLFYGLKNCTAQ